MNQALLFQSLRARLLRNSWRLMIGQSSMRPVTILLCSLVVWIFVFAISWGGFLFLQHGGRRTADRRDRRHPARLAVPVAGVAAHFLQRPDPVRQPVHLGGDGIPAVAAGRGRSGVRLQVPGRGGVQQLGLPAAGDAHPDRLRPGRRRPWYFYVLLPLFFLGFVLLPGSLGALAVLLIVNFVPQQRKQVLGMCLVVLLIALAVWIYRMIQSSSSELWQEETREAVTRLLGYFQFTRNPLAPSHWVSLGLRRVLRGELGVSSYYLALVWATDCFCT